MAEITEDKFGLMDDEGPTITEMKCEEPVTTIAMERENVEFKCDGKEYIVGCAFDGNDYNIKWYIRDNKGILSDCEQPDWMDYYNEGILFQQFFYFDGG